MGACNFLFIKNSSGQLGIGSYKDSNFPVIIYLDNLFPYRVKIVQVASLLPYRTKIDSMLWYEWRVQQIKGYKQIKPKDQSINVFNQDA